MASSPQETELKFLCDPADVGPILGAAPEGATEVRDLISTYFDTTDADLAAMGASLRVRQIGNAYVQTLKRGQGPVRDEEEAELPGSALDLTMPALKALLPGAKRRGLAPRFSVGVSRTQRTFAHEAAQIELAIDQGEIAAGDRAKAICELELELKDGPPQALFDLARNLSRTAPLYLSFDSKAAQGQMLRNGMDQAPRRNGKLPLSPDLTAVQAFQIIAYGALAQIAANAVMLRQADSVEGVHQLRVGIRRLRSAMTLFKSMVGGDQAETLEVELAWLAAASNDARDLDVFAADNARLAAQDPSLTELAELEAVVAAAQARAHAKIRGVLTSGRFRNLILETAAWTATGDWLDKGGKTAKRREMRAARFVVAPLDRRLKGVFKRGKDLLELDDPDRHKVRIQAKKLRYAVEAFATLFPKKGAGPYIKLLKIVQEELGSLNDVVVAEELVERLAPQGPALDAAERLVAARASARPRHLKAADNALRKLAKQDPFWAM